MSSSRNEDGSAKEKRRKGKEKETAAGSTSIRPPTSAPRKNSAISTSSAPAAGRSKRPSTSGGQPHPSHHPQSGGQADAVKRAQSGNSYLSERRGHLPGDLELSGPYRSKKTLLTLLIDDTRYKDPQLEEIWIELRSAPGIDGYWADALEVTNLLQDAPGRIEGPAKVYAKRQGFRQIFLSVSTDGTYSCKPTNLQVLDGRSLQLWVEKWPGDPELFRAPDRFHPYNRDTRSTSRDGFSPSDFPGPTNRSDVDPALSHLRPESPMGRSSTPGSTSAVPASSHDSPMSEASQLSYLKMPVARPPVLSRLLGKRKEPSPPPSPVADMDRSDYGTPSAQEDWEPEPNPSWAQSDGEPMSVEEPEPEPEPEPETEPEPEPEPEPAPTPKPMPKPKPKPAPQATPARKPTPQVAPKPKPKPKPKPAHKPTPKPMPQPKPRGPSESSEPLSQPTARQESVTVRSTRTPTPQQEMPPPSRSSQPPASDANNNSFVGRGVGIFGAAASTPLAASTPRSTSGFGAFATPRAASGGFAAFASSAVASPSASSPAASAFGVFAMPSPGGVETHGKSRRWLADKSGPTSTQDAMIEYVTGLLEEDSGWVAFESERRMLLPMVRYIEHLRWQKSTLDRLNGQPIPVEIGMEPGTTITPELMMAVYHAQPSYENILNDLLRLADLYGPGAPDEDPEAVAAFNETPVTTPMHQIKKCLQVLQEVDARVQDTS